MANTGTEAPKQSFQYRLRFFHKCRSPAICDPGQLDRFQVQGSTLESTCGAPIIVVLVRYRHDLETGLSRECQRAQFPAGRSLFAVKAVVVPSESVLEYMDQSLLQQPRLMDSQGRNLLGGPDVSQDGCIYASPLESNGIAHLNNFSMMLPWSELDDTISCTSDGACGRQQGSAMDGQLGPGSRVMQSSADSRPELCLVVQLLKRDPQRPGRWFAYDMPHLVSRPFQVISRETLASMQLLTSTSSAPAPFLQEQALYRQQKRQQPQQQQLPYQQLLSHQRLAPMALQEGYTSAPRPQGGYNPDPIPAFGSCFSPPALVTTGSTTRPGVGAPLQSSCYAPVGAEASAGFVLGASQPGGPTVGVALHRASAGGAGEGHRSSTSGGSPHGHRGGSRSRRRSCLSRDSSHDDGSVGVAGTAAGTGPVRTPSGASTAEAGICAAMLRSAGSATDTAAPASSPSRGATAFATAAPSADALAESPVASRGLGGGGPASEALRQAPSVMLVDVNIPPMEIQGTFKRARPSAVGPDATPLASGNSSSNVMISPAVNNPSAMMTILRQSSREEETGGGVSSAHCSGTRQFMAQQSDVGSWPAGAMADQQLAAMREQSTGLSGNTGFVVGNAPVACTAAALAAGVPQAVAALYGSVGASGSCGSSNSQLDALVHQLLGQPNAMQEALDRMEQEEQQLQHVQAQSLGGGNLRAGTRV